MKRFVINTEGVFTGPKAVGDQRLNAGSLVLIEPGYPMNPWIGGAQIPNYASESARLLVAVPSDADNFTVAEDSISESTGLVERTAKGGLHFAIKQSGSVESDQYRVEYGHSLWAYLSERNSGPDVFYASVWGHVTRPIAGSSLTVGFGPTHSTGSSTRFGAGQNTASKSIVILPTSATNKTEVGLLHGVGPFRADVSRTFISGVLNKEVVKAGNTAAAVIDRAPSWILYAMYLENLTVSGLTYSEARAKDEAAYTNAFSPGGRYHNDSWTDPMGL